ncbi:MAG: hypothetical protein J7L43_02265, partial [Candidatus Aenigmarchaeota archaeon]|nr:hypothetical protein [Candidatus Aenigmarchaeota archaeon]
ALASVSAVSDISITSSKGEGIGNKLNILDGKIITEEFAAPKGTTVIVKNLFFNTPARRKYLSSDATELKHIIDIVSRYNLAHPEISFTLVHNDLEILNAPKGDLLSKILSIYGREIAENVIEVNHEGVLGIQGYIGSMTITKKTRDFQSFFVNNRYIKSDLIRQAVEDAYKSILFLERRPVAILNFIINPNKIDVNIHPTKLEVKFDNNSFIKSEIVKILREVLSHNIKHEKKVKEEQVKLENVKDDFIEKETLHKERFGGKSFVERGNFIESSPHIKDDEVKNSVNASGFIERNIKEHNVSRENQNLIRDVPAKERDYKILGQVHKTFIVAETIDGMMIVDQHAAAERINLERIEDMMKLDDKSQVLLSPVIVKPQKKDVGLIYEILPTLSEFGYDIEPFGNSEFIIRKVPIVIKTELNNLDDFFDELVENIKNSKKDLINDEIIYTMACKGSIKANHELSIKEMYDLLDDLFKTRFPYSCAHGRPTILKFTRKELDKMFKRT